MPMKKSRSTRKFDEFCHNYPGGFGVKYNDRMPSRVPDSLTHFGMNIPLFSPILATCISLYFFIYYAFPNQKFYSFILVYLAIELLFIIYYRRRAQKLCKQDRNIVFQTHEQRKEIVSKMTEREHIGDVLEGWFGGISVKEIQRENVCDMISANFFSKKVSDLTADEINECSELYSMIEVACHYKFESGRNENLQPYQHLVDDLNVVHHPLIFYLYSYLGDTICSMILRFRGYKRGKQGCLHFWYLPKVEKEILDEYEEAEESDQRAPPFVFLHGIGIGLSVYTHFIQTLSCGNRITILIDLPWISLRMVEEVPPMDEVVTSIKEIMALHGISASHPATCIGHSYGTFVLSAFLKKYPSLVKTPVFVDPVCFSLYIHNVVKNFVYHAPTDYLDRDWFRYFVFSRDLYMANVICRNLYWYEVNMWAEDIPKDTIICLSGQDELAPTDHVKASLESRSNDIHVIYHEKLTHGEFLAHPKIMAELIEKVKRVESRT